MDPIATYKDILLRLLAFSYSPEDDPAAIAATRAFLDTKTVEPGLWWALRDAWSSARQLWDKRDTEHRNLCAGGLANILGRCSRTLRQQG